jgi:outer membrane receptor protein involved in Fe transport
MYRASACTLVLTLFAALQAVAQSTSPDEKKDTVIVWGRGIDLIGEAHAASEGVVGYADFETRPIARIGELVEVIPGVIATQHSGEGKANQYFLRGFNLDHGTDFSVSVDGVPVNLRSHGHGQGYLDLNFVIPELVERVEYRKGPTSARAGDFSSAGSAAYITRDTLEDSFVELGIGENGYLRGVAATSVELGGANLLLAGEGQATDGPWDLPSDLRKLNGVAKLTFGSDAARFGIEAWAYDSKWNSTDQVPERAIRDGRISRLGFIDGDLGGQTSRYALLGSGDFTHADGATTTARAYAVSYDFQLISNFTYFLDDPVRGDEFTQIDRRWVFGGSLVHERDANIAGRPVKLAFGAETRLDDIRDVGLFQSVARERVAMVRRDRVEEGSFGAFAEAEVNLTDRLRATLGVRADAYRAEVSALSLPANGGETNDALASPNLALAWQATDSLELYANHGRGFHSNDARGATLGIDPKTGDPAESVPLLVASEGSELGARIERGGLNATLTAFWLELDSELVFVGDAGTTEPNNGSRRTGLEATAFWEVNDWLVLDGAYAWTDAKFLGTAAGEDRIPGSVEEVVSGGAVVRLGDVTGSLRVRHFGEAPLIEDGSASSDPTTLVNLGASWDIGRWTLSASVLNLFDAEDADITYFYESQLAGEPAPVADRHLHPVEPRQVRLGMRMRF